MFTYKQFKTCTVKEGMLVGIGKILIFLFIFFLYTIFFILDVCPFVNSCQGLLKVPRQRLASLPCIRLSLACACHVVFPLWR